LDLLNTLPKTLSYNLLQIASSPLGYKHTAKALALMSGANNHMYGKAPANAFPSGALNPMFGRTGTLHPMCGITPTNAMTINVYSLDNKLVRSFTSQIAAANWLNIPRITFQRYLSSGKVWNNQYIFRKSVIS